VTAARPYSIRPATPGDQSAIVALVWAEGLNTEALRWPDCLVAVDETRRLIGTVQLRRHADGARELASLVVVPEWRGRGLAARLVEALLAPRHERVLVVVDAAHAARYERWGFVPLAPGTAPRSVRRVYRRGQWWMRLRRWRGEAACELVILARPAPVPVTKSRVRDGLVG
jgi:amino-acid N-acetyltransferase